MTQAQERVWSEAFSDAELITAVREGDTSAYGALYERHAAAARTVARQYVRSTADADDVVSDAFARTLSVLQGGGGPDVTFRAYLFTVVRRLSYDLVNGARRTQPTDDERTFETAFGPMASTEDPTLEGFERSTVTRAYQELPERWRAVLWYTEVESLSPAEIAPILGLTANGVSALAYRAREGLRQAYLQQHLTSVPAEECRAVNALLGSYVRGGLAKRETARVESHLDGCGECRGLVLELGDVSHGMRAVIAPLVFGVGALGLVGTALPTFGGAAVAGGVGAALQGSSNAGAGSAGGSGAAGGSGGTAAGAGGGGAAGTSVAGTGAVGGAGAAAGATGGSGGAVGAGAAVGGAAAAGGATAGGGALAAAGGLVALVSSAPLAAAAVTVGVLAVAGLSVAGAMGVFSPDPEPAPTAQSSPSPTESPTTGTTATPDPTTDPTSPTNIPPAPTDETTAGTGDTTGTGDGTTGDGAPIGSEPGSSSPGGAAPDPGTGAPGPTDPGTSDPGPVDPGPTDPGTPEPAPAALELSLAPVTLAARQPADLVMTASNTGGRSAEEVFVDLTLPAGVSTQSASLVARGAAAAGPVRAAALPCGSAVPQSDGSSRVTCSVGVLAPRATQDLAVQVQADSGGEYAFTASLRAKGIEPSHRSFPPTQVSYWGPELRVTAEPVLAFDNPGDATLRVALRNSGDRPAVEPRVTVDLPDGLSLVGGGPAGWTCDATEDGTVTCASPNGTTLAPRATVDVAVRLLADLADVPDDVADLQVEATADGAHTGRASVDPEVDAPWAAAGDGLLDPDGERRAVVPQCAATDGGLASVLATYTNTTAYDDLTVTAHAAGSTATAVLAARETATLRVDDGVRFPAGRASLVLSTTVAGETFTIPLDAGAFAALDCWTPPPWLTAADVDVVADNDGGTVRYTATVTNGTGAGLDARLLAPDAGTWSGVADSAAIAPLADGRSGDLVLDTGLRDTTRANAVLRQYRWHTDADGDGKGYQSLLPVLLEGHRIAPAAPAPTVGQCAFDPATDTSSAPVTLHLDNTASTLPVTFSVPGVSGPVSVRAGATQTVTTTVGGESATFAVQADGAPLASHPVRGVDCFDWNVSGAASASWVPSDAGGSVVLTGTFRNGHAAARLSVVLEAGGWGTSGPVEVGPGEEVSLAVDTGSRDVAAGEVVLRATRADGSPGTHEVAAAFAAVRYAPSVGEPVVGTCAFDAATETSSAPVALRYDNSRSTVPVVFSVAGRDDLTQTVAGGRAEEVSVPGGVGSQGLTLAVLADGAASVSHELAGVDCFDWGRVAGAAAATAAWTVPPGAGVGSAFVTGTFHNPYTSTPLRVAMSTPHGDAAPVEVAPGADATFTVDAKALSVPAGTATFTVERAGGAPQTVEARYGGVTYSPQWARTATVEARWQDGSVKLVGSLTNDSPETIDARMLGGAHGDSAPVQKIAPGQTATFTIDTRSLDAKPGAVSFRQYRSVLGQGFVDVSLTATHRGATYVPDWSATLTAVTQCAAGPDGVVLTVGLRNDSGEPTHVVASTPFGVRDLGDVPPGGGTSVDVATGALAVKGGTVTFELSRTVLGTVFTQKVTAHFAARDCAVVRPTASLVLGDPVYDGDRDHSYRAVSVLLDNAASNVPVTFRVTGQAKGSWDLAAGERRTVELGEAPWSGATYVVHAGSWSQPLKVDPFTAARQCPEPWQSWTAYDHSAEVSYRGWTYAARNSHFGVRPDDPVLGWLFWERQSRCGEG
ncbi:sigma-70 family RNA polymerase sigma factor [Cellulosimicrobium protaetiae]|uniref:Sigma-70 family RNA polymerase sigma factor n=1 Tax=Cellulosimicrobium protaetiae TaxID=2587808 RepID=A0A6M5UAW2_9MICO|nr:sigma-70 family RNA polymerase sigma factor [Cellulosimicrobium protaetiae]QJW35637.1 sigma-70 family RNA polymerase sigma factor [Cellulosimicrobium protaetiae]